jgi:hypothetical protein
MIQDAFQSYRGPDDEPGEGEENQNDGESSADGVALQGTAQAQQNKEAVPDQLTEVLSESDFDREPSQASVQVLQVEDKELQEAKATPNRRSSMLQSFNNSK